MALSEFLEEVDFVACLGVNLGFSRGALLGWANNAGDVLCVGIAPLLSGGFEATQVHPATHNAEFKPN